MPTGLDSRLHGNDGFQDYGVLGMTVRVFLTIRVFLTGWILKVLRRCRVRKGGCIERAVGWASAHQSHQFHRIKGFWGIGVIRRFRFPAALMDLTESLELVGLVILE
ncbi:Uncharacterised protein [Neisseria lactamica]|nr:Uncharacterised protein [Neisseria lactamica]